MERDKLLIYRRTGMDFKCEAALISDLSNLQVTDKIIQNRCPTQILAIINLIKRKTSNKFMCTATDGTRLIGLFCTIPDLSSMLMNTLQEGKLYIWKDLNVSSPKRKLVDVGFESLELKYKEFSSHEESDQRISFPVTTLVKLSDLGKYFESRYVNVHVGVDLSEDYHFNPRSEKKFHCSATDGEGHITIVCIIPHLVEELKKGLIGKKSYIFKRMEVVKPYNTGLVQRGFEPCELIYKQYSSFAESEICIDFPQSDLSKEIVALSDIGKYHDKNYIRVLVGIKPERGEAVKLIRPDTAQIIREQHSSQSNETAELKTPINIVIDEKAYSQDCKIKRQEKVQLSKKNSEKAKLDHRVKLYRKTLRVFDASGTEARLSLTGVDVFKAYFQDDDILDVHNAEVEIYNNRYNLKAFHSSIHTDCDTQPIQIQAIKAFQQKTAPLYEDFSYLKCIDASQFCSELFNENNKFQKVCGTIEFAHKISYNACPICRSKLQEKNECIKCDQIKMPRYNILLEIWLQEIKDKFIYYPNDCDPIEEGAYTNKKVECILTLKGRQQLKCIKFEFNDINLTNEGQGRNSYLTGRCQKQWILSKEIIGRGANGCVFKATNRLDWKQYALKLLKMDSDKHEALAMAEVRKMAKVEHHNVVKFISTWIEKRDSNFHQNNDELSNVSDHSIYHIFIQMELCTTSFQEFIGERNKCHQNTEYSYTGEIPIKTDWIDYTSTDVLLRMNKVLHGIVQGLNYIHSRNEVHGDLHTGNVLLCYTSSTNEVTPKIADFGVATYFNKTSVTEDDRQNIKPPTISDDLLDLSIIVSMLFELEEWGTSARDFPIQNDWYKRLQKSADNFNTTTILNEWESYDMLLTPMNL